MGFIALIRIAVFALCTWLLWRGVSAATGSRGKQGPKQVAPMVRCTYCHIYLPEGNSLEEQGRWFCSEAHLRSFEKEGPRSD